MTQMQVLAMLSLSYNAIEGQSPSRRYQNTIFGTSSHWNTTLIVL